MRNSTGKPPSVSLSVPEILFFHEDCPNKGSLSYKKKISVNLSKNKLLNEVILMNNPRKLKTVQGNSCTTYQKVFYQLILKITWNK